MENLVYYFLCFGGLVLGAVVGTFYYGTTRSIRYEEELMDRLRPTRSPWDIINERCSYCNGKLSLVTDRCTHCGAPK